MLGVVFICGCAVLFWIVQIRCICKQGRNVVECHEKRSPVDECHRVPVLGDLFHYNFASISKFVVSLLLFIRALRGRGFALVAASAKRSYDGNTSTCMQ